MIKPMMVGFVLFVVDATLGVEFENIAEFQGSEMSPRLFEDFMDGYIKP